LTEHLEKSPNYWGIVAEYTVSHNGVV
jgi:hypothetical protein